MSAATSCVGDDPAVATGDGAPGTAGNACLSNGTCNAGLACVTGTCVVAGGDGSTPGTDGGTTSDAPSSTDGGIDSPFVQGDGSFDGGIQFRANLNAAGVPSTNSTSTAVALLTFHEDTSRLCGTLTFDPLVVDFTVNSGRVLDSKDSFQYFTFTNVSPTMSPHKLNVQLSATQVAKLRDGDYSSVELRTVANPQIAGPLQGDPSGAAQMCE